MPRKQRFKPSRKPKPVAPPVEDPIIEPTREVAGPEGRTDVIDANPPQTEAVSSTD